jgi:hypothetical protein
MGSRSQKQSEQDLTSDGKSWFIILVLKTWIWKFLVLLLDDIQDVDFGTKKSRFLEAMDEDRINSQTKFAAARNNTLQSAVSSSDNGNVAV